MVEEGGHRGEEYGGLGLGRKGGSEMEERGSKGV